MRPCPLAGMEGFARALRVSELERSDDAGDAPADDQVTCVHPPNVMLPSHVCARKL